MNRITKWATMSPDERQEHFGDPSIDRTVQSEAYAKYCAERLQAGLPLSIDGRRKARKFLKLNHGRT